MHWNLWSQLRVNDVFVVEMCIFMIFHILILSYNEKGNLPKFLLLSVHVVGFYTLIWTTCRVWFLQGSGLDRWLLSDVGVQNP